MSTIDDHNFPRYRNAKQDKGGLTMCNRDKGELWAGRDKGELWAGRDKGELWAGRDKGELWAGRTKVGGKF
ncbi:hypothetical protein [Meiothermus granaticius]|nr:hypothetical protein [Meiothermus granaticius]MCL6525923.1 hypothetical protein [Thermaceae bacterium]GEM85443.1 hypothetical protein MGR01S_00680 [Meiothermus granaticius NBRC 107808]